MRPLFLICLIPCLCQCGGGPSTPSKQAPEDTETTAEKESAPILVEAVGMDIRLWGDTRGTGGSRVGPTFWVHAEKGYLDEATGQSVLEGVRAVVYRDNAENLTITAPAGMADENRKVASMSGGVTVEAGTSQIMTAEIEWDDESGIAESTGDVLMQDGDTRLDAEGLTLYADENEFELLDVRGRFDFGAEEGRTASNRAVRAVPVVLAAAVSTVAQETPEEEPTGFVYDYIEIHRVGYLQGNYATRRLLKMAEGVFVTFVAADETKNLSIRAQTVTFVYASEEVHRPSKILLEGEVTVKYGEYTMTSEHGEVDFDKGEASFTGSPEVEGPFFERAMKLERCIFNLNDNEIIAYSPHDSTIKLPDSSEPSIEKTEPAPADEIKD